MVPHPLPCLFCAVFVLSYPNPRSWYIDVLLLKNETDLRSALGKHNITNSQKPNTNLQQSSSQNLKSHPIQSKDKKAYSVIGQQSIDLNLTLSDSSIGEQGASAVSNSVCLYDAVRNEEEQVS